MPRTKAKRSTIRGKISQDEVEELCRRFDEQVELKREKLNREYDAQVIQLNVAFKMMLQKYHCSLKKTIRELRIESATNDKENCTPQIIVTKMMSAAHSLSSQKDDDVQSVASTNSHRSRRLSRSLSRSNVNKGLSRASSQKGSANRLGPRNKRSSSACSGLMGPPHSSRRPYRTPSSIRAPQYPPITPKVAPNTPMAVLRRPRQGEMVVSLHGSPLLVNSITGVDKANCNIPLSDGTVLSILPSKLKESNCYNLPFDHMSENTRNELKILQNNLTECLKKRGWTNH